MKLLCATTNPDKFGTGKETLKQYGVELEQVIMEIAEIQHEDATAIIEDKVAKAFAILQKPVVVTDDSWSIAALGGFPGPYMKSINHWFTPEDFMRLMTGHTDRQIALHQLVAYTDGVETVIFSKDLVGEVVEEPRGTYGPTIMHVVAFPEDNGMTISEVYDTEGTHASSRLEKVDNGWHELGKWLAVHRA